MDRNEFMNRNERPGFFDPSTGQRPRLIRNPPVRPSVENTATPPNPPVTTPETLTPLQGGSYKKRKSRKIHKRKSRKIHKRKSRKIYKIKCRTRS
jgi:hypothetical protein